jgi:hypothetical protein
MAKKVSLESIKAFIDSDDHRDKANAEEIFLLYSILEEQKKQTELLQEIATKGKGKGK